ncbi:hypothetical protein [Candidatus Villigracilis saccharophilus]|uniref:hypothetical protein n=1 Tax=Candidatus Villigracilis saccharophilus TaxID=3140684 RepID=UPI003134F604|nr:hypothetical protein [Anaerolineales bacterium]
MPIMLIGWGIGVAVAVAVGKGVRVCVASGINVFVELGIMVGRMGIFAGAAAWELQALAKREIVIKTNKVFFIAELHTFKKTEGGVLLRPPSVFIFYVLGLFRKAPAPEITEEGRHFVWRRNR